MANINKPKILDHRNATSEAKLCLLAPVFGYKVRPRAIQLFRGQLYNFHRAFVIFADAVWRAFYRKDVGTANKKVMSDGLEFRSRDQESA